MSRTGRKPKYLADAKYNASEIEWYTELLIRHCNSIESYYSLNEYSDEQIEKMKSNACFTCEFIIELAQSICDMYNKNPIKKG